MVFKSGVLYLSISSIVLTTFLMSSPLLHSTNNIEEDIEKDNKALVSLEKNPSIIKSEDKDMIKDENHLERNILPCKDNDTQLILDPKAETDKIILKKNSLCLEDVDESK